MCFWAYTNIYFYLYTINVERTLYVHACTFKGTTLTLLIYAVNDASANYTKYWKY